MLYFWKKETKKIGMKKYIVTCLMLIFAISFWNCEKDDLCADGTITTPQLVIEFYDATDNTLLKNVTNLRVEELGTGRGVVFSSSLASDNDDRYLTNDNTIKIPLKTFEDISQFEFKFNYGDTTESVDEITFDYSREDIYISRACGYKTNFTLNTVTLNSNNWITNYTIEQPNITNEDEVHVKIYF